MPQRYIQKVASLAEIRNLPNAAGIGSYGGGIFLNANGTPQLIAPGTMGGRTYFVNNITGSASYDGLSPDKPFAEVSQAITASEAFRLAQVANNTMVRNRIYIQGTATAYAALTALPNWCDLIGIGASPHGNGSGIARINGAAAADAIASAITRGNYFANLQFATAGSFWCMDVEGMLRTIFEDCCWLNDAAAADGCFRSTGNFAGNVLRRCTMLGDSGYPVYGFKQESASAWNSNVIEDCPIIMGTTAGIFLATNANSVGSVIRHNVIGDFGGGCAKGIDDNSNCLCMIVGNYISATDAIERTSRGNIGVIDNQVIDGTTAARELA